MQFVLRKWRPEDAGSIVKYADNKKIADNLRDGFPHPYSLSDAQNFIKNMGPDSDVRICLAIEIGGEAAGSIGVFLKEDVYRKSAEIGYWLGEPFWGQGVITDAIREICEIAFGKFDIVRIYAEPYAYNTGSRRALEKAGFTLEGVLKKSVCKNGEIFDSCIYALVK
jgi:ribosomal-protein-alanine N-acetyltransferase